MFDIVTLSRIDDSFALIQQFIYLLLLFFVLYYKILEDAKHWAAPPEWARFWQYSNDAFHFVLGSLLSSYTLFYFVSSSLATSLLFLVVLTALLIINELPQFQSSALYFKVAAVAICVFSYLFIVMALLLGFVGYVPVVLALLSGIGLFLGAFWFFARHKHPTIDVRKILLFPPGYVALALVILYALKLLPPIPLSIQYIGIYHGVEKRPSMGGTKDGLSQEFHLKYNRPRWKFWQNGAQDFIAEPGDQVYCFVRLFAPSGFNDTVFYHWLKKEKKGWQTVDRVATLIKGGRDAGFRTFAHKSNFSDGDWRVQLETTDGREIGRISFSVQKQEVADPAREFRTDVW